MDKSKPTDTNARAKSPPKEGSLEHVVRTGLPPGIDAEDVKDPGKNSPKGPTDNRS